MTITVWSLAIDDDCGTSAQVFPTELAAVKALLDWLGVEDPTERDELVKLYYLTGENDDSFYDRVAELKKDYDTYSIDPHTLEVAIPLPETRQLV